MSFTVRICLTEPSQQELHQIIFRFP